MIFSIHIRFNFLGINWSRSDDSFVCKTEIQGGKVQSYSCHSLAIYKYFGSFTRLANQLPNTTTSFSEKLLAFDTFFEASSNAT